MPGSVDVRVDHRSTRILPGLAVGPRSITGPRLRGVVGMAAARVGMPGADLPTETRGAPLGAGSSAGHSPVGKVATLGAGFQVGHSPATPQDVAVRRRALVVDSSVALRHRVEVVVDGQRLLRPAAVDEALRHRPVVGLVGAVDPMAVAVDVTRTGSE